MRRALLAGCATLLSAGPGLGQELQSSSPPFRIALLSVHRQREVMLIRAPWLWVDDRGAQRPIDGRAARSRTTGSPDFYARLRVTTEPPTFFRQDGPPRLEEAVDDLDQTLEPFDEAADEPRPGAVAQRGTYATRDIRLVLSLPEQPGKTIKRLKGTIPVALTTRAAEPRTVLDLAHANGQALTVGDARLSIVGVTIGTDRSATLKVSARLESEKGDFRDREYQERVAARLVDLVQRQLELIDDQSRVVTAYATTAVRRNEVRATLAVRPSETYGAPDRLRVWDLTRSVKALPFDFKDVPLP